MHSIHFSVFKMQRLAGCLLLPFFMLWLTLHAGSAWAVASVNFNGGAVSGCTLSGNTYSCSSFPALDWNGQATIASGYAVNVSSSLSFSFNQSLTMSGSAALTANGDLNIADISGGNLHISGGSLTASGGTFTVGNQVQTVTANISAAAVNLGSGSTVTVNGNISSTGPVAIGSHAVVNGAISGSTITTVSPANITGNVTATTSFSLASGSTMTGNVVAPTVVIQPASSTLNGNVTASTSVTMGSSDSISGNVVTPQLTLQSSDAKVGGDVTSGSVVLGWHGSIGGTIYCTKPGSGASCDCVSNNSGWAIGSKPGPVCAQAPVTGGLDHILLKYSANGLTCAPSPVEIDLCANSDCSIKYTGGGKVQLKPGGQQFDIDSSGVNSAGSIQQLTAGPTQVTTTWISGTAPTHQSICLVDGTAATDCHYTAADAGFLLSAIADHYANTSQSFTIRAVRSDTSAVPVCVPAVTSPLTVNFNCTYVNPTAGTLPVRLTSASNSSGNCSPSSNTGISVPFNGNGSATLNMAYADVGNVKINASYSGNGIGGNFSMNGSTQFVAAPKSFVFSAIQTTAGSIVNPTDNVQYKFAAAGEQFKVTIKAFNSSNNLTPNFGNETTPASAELSGTLVAPTGSDASPGSLGGNPNGGTIGKPRAVFTNGVASPADLSWSEVGIITIGASNENLGYLTSTLVATGFSPQIGRFTPHHFSVAVVPPMPCPSALVSAKLCATGLAYARQPLAVTVTALNSAGAATGNYFGTFARDVTLNVWAWDGTNLKCGNAQQNPPANPAGNGFWPGGNATTNNASFALPSATPGTFTSGGKATISPAYAFGTAPTQPTVICLRANETDVDLYTGDVKTPGVTSQNGASTDEPQLTIVSGHLLIGNAYGSERLPLPIPLTAQYWDGNKYVLSGTDSVSPLTTNQFKLTNCTMRPLGTPCNMTLLGSTSVPAKPDAFTLSSGRGKIWLGAPGKFGTIDINSAELPYLPSTIGREVFGLYRSPVLYIREVY